MTQLFIFKSNIHSSDELNTVQSLLNLHPQVKAWNVDREDIDKVLRIECEQLEQHQLINLLSQYGIQCEELN